MLIRMNEDDLSRCYFLGTSRASKTIEDLYERLHNAKGDPNVNEEEVVKMVQECIRKVRSELDIIKTGVNEISATEEGYEP